VESPGLRHLLLEIIAAAREREHEFLALCDDSPPPEPGLSTVKDPLAHLTAWRLNVAQLLDSGRTGTEAPRMDEDVQASNARVYAANKDKAAELVKSNARAAYDRLEAAIAACSEEDLLKPHPRPRSTGVALWQTVPGHAHPLAEHLMFWHLDRGNEEAAEAAQLWVHGLDRAQFPEPKAVAASMYDLGCFYVHIGREDEALLRFKLALELDPSLKKLAQTDPGLERIRNHPELAALFAQ
jgi:tetratricopeptide (TPR) repeat protein